MIQNILDKACALQLLNFAFSANHVSATSVVVFFSGRDEPVLGSTVQNGENLDFCQAMLCISAAYAVVRCLSVCPAVLHDRLLCQNE